MKHEQLQQILQTIADEEIETDMDLWPMIQEQLETTRSRKVRRPLYVVKLIAAAALTLLVGAVGYAFYQSTIGDEGLAAVDESGLLTHLDLTQTIDDVSVMLDYAYADANRISIATRGAGTTLQVPGMNPQVGLVSSELRDGQGRVFDTVITGGGGGGGGGSVDPSGTPVPVEFSFGQELSYDASAIADEPAELDLRLELVVGPTMGRGGGGGGSADAMATTEDDILFVFEFSVPFNPGRTLDAPQTVTADGFDLTLEQVVVTPSLTRLMLCFANPEGEAPAPHQVWVPVVNLNIGDESLMNVNVIGKPGTTDAACTPYFIPLALADREGDWTLTVESLRLSNSEDWDDVAVDLRQAFEAADAPAIVEAHGFRIDETASEEEIEQTLAIVRTVVGQHQQGIDGPWVFQFSPS